jgi:26S proteasome regulatory subunit N5
MEELIEREKGARLNGNKDLSREILLEMVHVAGTPAEVLEIVKLMSKKKGQLKESLRGMIYYAYKKVADECGIRTRDYSFREVGEMEFLNIFAQEEEMEMEGESSSVFLQLLRALLKDVVEGRMYLEQERVLITDAMKQIYLSEGRNRDACGVLYNVHVETFSSLSVEDIVKYQLEQMQSAIKTKDWNKVTILSKRVNRKSLEEIPHLTVPLLKREVFMHLGNKEYLEAAKAFKAIGDLQGGDVGCCLLSILYAVVGGPSAEGKAIISEGIRSKECTDFMRELGESFLSNRIISRGQILSYAEGDDRALEAALKANKVLLGARINEHNLVVLSKYYSRVSVERVSHVLELENSEGVELVSDLIRSGRITGRINQLKEVVEFEGEKSSGEDWSTGISTALDLVIRATHHISKDFAAA